jgi:hypothetical protein
MCIFFIKNFAASKLDVIVKIKSLFGSLSNESKNQANSKKSYKGASMDMKNLMNTIHDPSKSILQDLLQINKEMNMQNVVLMNVLKFLVVT